MPTASILAADFKTTPYWIDSIGVTSPPGDPAPLPPRADVVVVGGGHTGVAAAWELARGGRDVLVLDAAEPGEGASSVNAGMLGRNFKHTFLELQETCGLDTAKAYFVELHEVYRNAVQLIRSERIDCKFRKCGRFIGALSPPHRDRLFREYEARARHVGEEVVFVKDPWETEIGSRHYFGGVRIIDNAAIQPAMFYRALRRRAEAVGARIIGHTPVLAIDRGPGSFTIHTKHGAAQARDVLVATNGYTSGATPWFKKRLSPINAYMIATEPMSPNRAKSVLRAHRTYSDNRFSPNYMQLSPDETRLLFGGRTGLLPSSLRKLAVDLHREMVCLFPELEDVKIEYAWSGRCAVTADLFPHTGVHEGIHYSLGYCFSGNAMAPYLGAKAAKRILGSGDADTIFEARELTRIFWPARQDRLIQWAMHAYRWRDRQATRIFCQSRPALPVNSIY